MRERARTLTHTRRILHINTHPYNIIPNRGHAGLPNAYIFMRRLRTAGHGVPSADANRLRAIGHGVPSADANRLRATGHGVPSADANRLRATGHGVLSADAHHLRAIGHECLLLTLTVFVLQVMECLLLTLTVAMSGRSVVRLTLAYGHAQCEPCAQRLRDALYQVVRTMLHSACATFAGSLGMYLVALRSTTPFWRHSGITMMAVSVCAPLCVVSFHAVLLAVLGPEGRNIAPSLVSRCKNKYCA